MTRPTTPQTRAARQMRQTLITQSFWQKMIDLRWWLLGALGLVIVGFVAGLIVVHFVKASNTSGEAELQAVETKIAKHYLLPTDEVPALATVTDKSKLTAPIFKPAENGDKILIYQHHKLAIIYRPSIDRIVATGPVSIDAPPGGQQ